MNMMIYKGVMSPTWVPDNHVHTHTHTHTIYTNAVCKFICKHVYFFSCLIFYWAFFLFEEEEEAEEVKERGRRDRLLFFFKVKCNVNSHKKPNITASESWVLTGQYAGSCYVFTTLYSPPASELLPWSPVWTLTCCWNGHVTCLKVLTQVWNHLHH